MKNPFAQDGKKRFQSQFLVILPLFLIISGMAYTASDMYFSPTDGEALGHVYKFKPLISVENMDREMMATKGTILMSGDTVTTDENGFALIQFIDSSFARVKPHTELVVRGDVVNGQNERTRIGMEAGEVLLNVTQRSTTDFQVLTSTSVASVKGTIFGATFDNYFYVREGEVELNSETGELATLTEQMFGQVNGDGSIDTGMLTDQELDDMIGEYDALEERTIPRTLRLNFVDANGQIRTIEIELYDN